MTDTSPHGATAISLRDRIAAQGLMEHCTQARRITPDRTRMATLTGRRPLDSGDYPYYRGALGELRVGRVLDVLGRDFVVLHSVPVGTTGTDIDHVVIGRTGVFTINTKHHEGKTVSVIGRGVRVSGYRQDHVRNSLSEAKGATARIQAAVGFPLAVTPLLVVVGAQEIRRGRTASLVRVLSVDSLRATLNRGRKVLTPEQVQHLGTVLARPSVWSPLPLEPLSPTLVSEFASLHREARNAYFVRMAWAVGPVVAVGIVVLLLFASLVGSH